MNSETPIKQLIDAALAKIGDTVDMKTVIGEPIELTGDVTLIPISKVTVGIVSGGSEFAGKSPRADGNAYFAGGNGAGVSMTPLGFIAVEQGRVRVIELGNILTYDPPRDLVNRTLDGINGIIDKTPSIVEKILNLFGRKGADEEADDTAGQPQNEENSED